MEEIRIEMSGNKYFIPVIRNALGRISCGYGFNEKEVYEIETIVDELCNNAIEHGSKGDTQKITVHCKYENLLLEMTVSDSGAPGFNPQEILLQNRKLMNEEIAKPRLDVIRRQRGLLIVQQFADTMDIISSPHETVVRILKKSRAGKPV
jgi:anti-sigma regulatory factor (Ser/Thr protein kinase)